ncbi:MAG: hypothetical protein P8Y45_22115 [Exilibacterium sp.]
MSDKSVRQANARQALEVFIVLAGRLDATPPYVDATREDYEYTREDYACGAAADGVCAESIYGSRAAGV